MTGHGSHVGKHVCAFGILFIFLCTAIVSEVSSYSNLTLCVFCESQRTDAFVRQHDRKDYKADTLSFVLHSTRDKQVCHAC